MRTVINNQIYDLNKTGRVTRTNVLPVGDSKAHKENEGCQCKPTVERFGLDLLIVHNSFDGREFGAIADVWE